MSLRVQRPPGRGGVALPRADGLTGHSTGPASLAAARERRHQANRAAEMQAALGLVCDWARAGLAGRIDLATAAANCARVARAAERIALAGEVEQAGIGA